MSVPGVTTVGIVGAGTMGVGIAQVALEAGHRVTIADRDPTALLSAARTGPDRADPARGEVG